MYQTQAVCRCEDRMFCLKGCGYWLEQVEHCTPGREIGNGHGRAGRLHLNLRVIELLELYVHVHVHCRCLVIQAH